jgi:hypothetical protein
LVLEEAGNLSVEPSTNGAELPLLRGRSTPNLASDESRFVNGTVIDVDGGRVGVAVIAS